MIEMRQCSADYGSFIAKIQDMNIPIIRNQNLIIKSIVAYQKDIFDVAYITNTVNKEFIARRHQLLEDTSV